MKRYRLLVGLALAGSIALYGTPYIVKAVAAGLFPGFPIVGVASYCAGSVSTATGTLTGIQTGCPNTVPAGPTIVTGSETIPADTNAASGVNPQTVLLSLGSLNALPITVQTSTPATTPLSISAANTSGGLIINSAVIVTALNVTLPSAPIDGQQYALSSNQPINTLRITGTNNGPRQIAVNVQPTSLTNATSTGQQIGYRFIYNAATTTWFRLY